MLETVGAQLSNTHIIEWLGTATGIIGVYLSIKEKLAAWALFILCYSCYIYLSFEAQLFAAIMMNSVFIILSIYGWLKWAKAATSEDTSAITHIPRAQLAILLAFICIGAGAFGWALQTYTEGAFKPYLDAFAMSTAFTAQWMLSRKYIETWLAWIVADVIYVVLWAEQGYIVSAGLFTIFIGLAIKGGLEWRQQLAKRLSRISE